MKIVMESKQRKRIVVCVFTVISLLFISGILHSQDNYVQNGDFEQVKDNQATFWKSTGTIKPEAISGVWQRLTCKFRSGAYKEVNFFFSVPQGSMGSVWIDNLVVGPQVQFKNPSFEELDTEGSLSGWRQDNRDVTVFSDSARVSDGKKSVRITHKNEAVPGTRIWQKFPVEPGREYTLSFDIFVGDDFQGEAKGWMFDPTETVSLDGDYANLLASALVEARDRSGRYVVALAPVAGAPAGLSQDVAIEPNANLQASVDFDNSALKGTAKFIIEDASSGRILKESNVMNVNAKWQSVELSFQSVSPKLRIRVIAEGSGSLQVDNAEITPPRITPPLQKVQWLPTTDNFNIPAQLAVSIQGQSGKAIDGGLELLGKDLKKENIVLARTESKEAPLKITIASASAIKGKGPESYSLTVNKEGVTIKAGAEPGAFYGLMTLLQLMENREGKPIVLACEITDYPDMPMRGTFYGDAEQAARWKMNTFMVSTSYPNTPAEKQWMHDIVQKCQNLNQKVIPMFQSMGGGYYVQGINPNLAAGIWVQDEKVILKGIEPSSLANPYVIRTKLTDVKLKSLDGKETYVLGKDYQVTNGDMAYNYDNPKAKLFTVARLAGSSIPEGATVLASYDWVSHYRASDNRTQIHIAYVPLESETRTLMDDFLRDMAKDYLFPYIHTGNDFHEFFVVDAILATDSRVINSGRKPIELFAEETRFQAVAIKQGNPKAKIMQWTGSMDNPYVRAGEPFLPKDAHINIWGYDANWPAAYGREAVEYWSNLGFETSVMPWYNLRNVRGWAQVVKLERQKGYPCLGMIDACWVDDGEALRYNGFEETAIVSWKIPKEGEKSFVALPKPEDIKTGEK